MSAIRSVLAGALGAATLCALVSCENGLFVPLAPLGPSARLSVAAATAAAGDAGDAFDRVDALHVRLLRGQQPALDTTLAFTAAGAETRVILAVELQTSPETLGLEVELRSGGTPVFRAAANPTLSEGETTPVVLDLVPVAADLSLSPPTPAFSAIGDTAWAQGAVLFATGDVLGGATPTWTALTPSILSARADGLLVALAEGQGQIQAAFGDVVRTMAVTVAAQVASVAVTPRGATLQRYGDPLRFTATARDRRGHLLTRTVAWTSSQPAVASIDATGLASPLAAGTTVIRAAVGAARDSATLTVLDTPPAAPGALAATAASSSRIDLTWTDNSANESGFRIERCTGAGCSGFEQIASVGANVTGYANTGLAEATTYGYRVRAFNATGTSGYSNTATAATPPSLPAPPTALSATAVYSDQINLSWTDNSNNETGFHIERCTGAGCSSFAEVGSVGAGATSFQDAKLAASTAYVYRVRAYNAAGNSGYSNTATATTWPPAQPQPPQAPGSLVATGVSLSRIDLSWTDNSNNETGFRIERCTGAECSSFSEIATVGANVRTFQNTGLAAGTTYGYRVRAYNDGGTSSYSNNYWAATLAGTAPVLSAGSYSLNRLNDPNCSLATPVGSSFWVTFNYYDTDGNVVTTSSAVGGTWVFSPSGNSGSVSITYYQSPGFDGNESSGSVQTLQCYRFGSDQYVDVTMTLRDGAGLTGQLNPIRITKPAGAN